MAKAKPVVLRGLELAAVQESVNLYEAGDLSDESNAWGAAVISAAEKFRRLRRGGALVELTRDEARAVLSCFDGFQQGTPAFRRALRVLREVEGGE
jgi:hypothetical protein